MDIKRSIIARRLTLAGLSIAALGLSACGNLAEGLAERALEAETGEQVDLDFSGDSGGITIKGENGEDITFGFDIDEDGGTFSIDGVDENGEEIDVNVNVDVDEEGTVMIDGTGPDGEAFEADFEVDEENGTFTIEGNADGEEFDATVDDDGTLTFETEEGSGSFQVGEDVPESWPLPVPGGDVVFGQAASTPEGQQFLLVVENPTVSVDDYVNQLTAGGYTLTNSSDHTGEAQKVQSAELSNDTYIVSVIHSDDGTQQTLTVSVTSS